MSAKVIMKFKDLNGRTTICDVHVFLNYGRDLIPNCFVITERPDNPGMSVTNNSENIATTLIEKYNLDPNGCVFIEHYDDKDGHSTPTWDQVSYQWLRHYRRGWSASSPTWSPISAEDLHLVIARMEKDDEERIADDIVSQMLEDND